jgi:hypothetical protein
VKKIIEILSSGLGVRERVGVHHFLEEFFHLGMEALGQ